MTEFENEHKKVICTLNGADDNTNINDLVKLSEKYPFVEWGVLLSLTKEDGCPRYPSVDWIYEFLDAKKRYSMNASLHLCGNVGDDYILDNRKFFFFNDFDRIQINVNEGFLNVTHALINRFQYRGYDFNKSFILQYNDKTKAAIEELCTEHSFFHVLKDASRGSGLPITDMSVPDFCKGNMMGFAGGIGRENIEFIFPNVYETSLHNNLGRVWVDMESSLRNSKDEFDIEQSEEILEFIDNFVDVVDNMCF